MNDEYERGKRDELARVTKVIETYRDNMVRLSESALESGNAALGSRMSADAHAAVELLYLVATGGE